MYQRFLPADHPDVLMSKRNLAVNSWILGNLGKSVPLFEEVLAVRAPTLGRLHPGALSTIADLGVNYKDAGRLAEALPLLEEAYGASKQLAGLGFVGAPLLDACTQALDVTNPDEVARLVARMREILAAARGMQDSVELARLLVESGLTLRHLQQWEAAEPLLRGALTVREENTPQDWETFRSMSLLGGTLLAQGKSAEAGPLPLHEARGEDLEAAALRRELEAERMKERERSRDAGE